MLEKSLFWFWEWKPDCQDETIISPTKNRDASTCTVRVKYRLLFPSQIDISEF